MNPIKRGLIRWLTKKEGYKYAPTANWSVPVFGQFGSDIYESDVVQQAIQCIVREMRKLKPVCSSNMTVQKVLDCPNEVMTTGDFIEKIIWCLYFNYNSFVVPEWDNGTLKRMWPIQPSTVEFVCDSSNELYVDFVFPNGIRYMVPYKNLIHIRFNYSVNDYMGGDQTGQPDHKALLKSLNLNESMLQGTAKAMKSSFAINGILKYNTLIDGDKMSKNLAELTERLNKNEDGFLPIDLKSEFIPFNRNPNVVGTDTLKFVDEKILRNFGVPLCILTGDYTKAQYEAFFQKTLEPIIESLNQEFTKKLRNNIVFYHSLLEFMTTSEKINFATLMSNTGAIMTNELRAMFGMPPYEDPALNIPVMSKNFGDLTTVKDFTTDK